MIFQRCFTHPNRDIVSVEIPVCSECASSENCRELILAAERIRRESLFGAGRPPALVGGKGH